MKKEESERWGIGNSEVTSNAGGQESCVCTWSCCALRELTAVVCS